MTPRGLALPLCSLGGMALGLAIDCTSVTAEALASLCATPGAWVAMLALHWTAMPAASTFMLLGAISAGMLGPTQASPTLRGSIGKALARAGCWFTMTLGMALGARHGAQLSAISGVPAFAGLMAVMGAGMVLGMLLCPISDGRSTCRP